MHTSGLILTFDDPAALRDVLDAGPFLLGTPVGASVPAVLEVADPHDARRWHEWAAARPGVVGIEVVFIHWDDPRTEVADAGA